MRPWPRVSEVSARIRTGASAGLTLRYCGLVRRLVGRSARAALMAACTSRAAPLMSRLRPNCSVMRVEPTVEEEVISVTSAIWPRCFSSGLATVVATSCGLAPGSVARTEMVGKSTCGSGDTGSLKNATAPAAARPRVSSVVATGRRMKGVDGCIASRPGLVRARGPSSETNGEAIEPEIDHGRGEQCQHLADEQAADDGNAERMAQFRTGAGADHERQRAEDRSHRGHDDRAEAQQA